jgi:hypothetical protein
MRGSAFRILRREFSPAGGQASTLADTTRAVLLSLAGAPDGFPLQVEGGRVDHTCVGFVATSHTEDLTPVLALNAGRHPAGVSDHTTPRGLSEAVLHETEVISDLAPAGSFQPPGVQTQWPPTPVPGQPRPLAIQVASRPHTAKPPGFCSRRIVATPVLMET